MIPTDRMPEAEVSFRLGHFLADQGLAAGRISIAIDGAQVRVGDRTIFPVREFLISLGWQPKTPEGWKGDYRSELGDHLMTVHSAPGRGDVVADLVSGRVLRVECKKGPLGRSKSSLEYPLIREALGQLITVEHVSKSDLLAVGVPSSAKFNELARRWREAPLIRRFGIQILTVSRDGSVDGLLER